MEEKRVNYELIDWEGKRYEFILVDTEDDFNIVFDYEDVDVDLSYDEGTDVPYGSTMVCYEPAGYYCDGHGDPEIRFLYKGEEVTKEEFLEELFYQLEITEEEFEKALEEMKKDADEKFVDYVSDNIDEYRSEPDEPDPDDYYDWRY